MPAAELLSEADAVFEAPLGGEYATHRAPDGQQIEFDTPQCRCGSDGQLSRFSGEMTVGWLDQQRDHWASQCWLAI
jgi:hypothetical protein